MKKRKFGSQVDMSNNKIASELLPFERIADVTTPSIMFDYILRNRILTEKELDMEIAEARKRR